MPQPQHSGDRDIGRRIAKARGNLSQRLFIEKLNADLERDNFEEGGPYTRAWLSGIEAGLRGIRHSDLKVIARALNVGIGTLLGVDSDGAERDVGPLGILAERFDGALTDRQLRIVEEIVQEFAEETLRRESA